jgi:hypothetical protein
MICCHTNIIVRRMFCIDIWYPTLPSVPNDEDSHGSSRKSKGSAHKTKRWSWNTIWATKRNNNPSAINKITTRQCTSRYNQDNSPSGSSARQLLSKRKNSVPARICFVLILDLTSSSNFVIHITWTMEFFLLLKTFFIEFSNRLRSDGTVISSFDWIPLPVEWFDVVTTDNEYSNTKQNRKGS